MDSSTPILHIYAQSGPHDEAFIVGNEAGLQKLLRVITLAINHHRATGLFFVSDGEGFCPIAVMSQEETLDRIQFPYTDAAYHEKGGGLGPGDRDPLVPHVLTRDQYRRLVKSDEEEVAG